MKPSQNDLKIHKALKKSVDNCGFPIFHEQEFPREKGYLLTLGLVIVSKCKSFNNLVILEHSTTKNCIRLTFSPYGLQIPADRLSAIEEMAKGYNEVSDRYYLEVKSQERSVSLLTFFEISQPFDQRKFENILQDFVNEGKEVMDKIASKIQGNKTPPVNIHINPPNRFPAFPLHTHGMTKMGLPEFILDPFAFNVIRNEIRFVRGVSFFLTSANKNKLEAIKNGSIVKLTNEDLELDVKERKEVHCFREVLPSFAAIKLAYEPDEIEPGITFIQMYSERDLHALQDDYYENGVRFGFLW